MTELEELRERLGKATGPDTGLDGEIAETLAQIDADYTASIDAALALVERCGWVPHTLHFGMIKDDGSRAVNAEVIRSGDADTWHDADAQTAPLAILKALISALIAEPAREKGDRT